MIADNAGNGVIPSRDEALPHEVLGDVKGAVWESMEAKRPKELAKWLLSFAPRITGTGLDVLLCTMRTLSEIEAAVDALSPSDREGLLEHLARKLGTGRAVTAESRAKPERWLRKLDQLRARESTGETGVPLQEILDDIRSEPR